MSGDVQPRKRKDKRRRRDEDEGWPATTPTRSGSGDLHPTTADSVTIHVHKEGGTGGHWCARIVFFALLAGLLGVVGLIILEHRGSDDVDTPLSKSQWAAIFEGWVDDVALREESHGGDDSLEDHEDHEDHEDQEEEEEEEEQEQEDDEQTLDGSVEQQEEPEEEEVDNVGDEDVEQGPDVPEEKEEEEEEEEEDAECSRLEEEADDEAERQLLPSGIWPGNDDGEDDSEDDGEDDEVPDERQDESEDSQTRDEHFETENDDGDELAQPHDKGRSHNKVNQYYDDDEGYGEESFDDDVDDLGALEEIEDTDDIDDPDDDVVTYSDVDLDVSIEGIQPTEDRDMSDYYGKEDDGSEEYVDVPGVDEMDDSAEPLEEIDDNELIDEIIDEISNEEEADDEDPEEEPTSMAMKFGVGIALIATAHFVVVRRWNNGETDDSEILSDDDDVPVISHQNTLLPQTRIQKVLEAETLTSSDGKFQSLEKTKPEKRVTGREKKRSGIEEIFAKKTADLELMLRGVKKESQAEKATEDGDTGEIVRDFEYSESDCDYGDDDANGIEKEYEEREEEQEDEDENDDEEDFEGDEDEEEEEEREKEGEEEEDEMDDDDEEEEDYDGDMDDEVNEQRAGHESQNDKVPAEKIREEGKLSIQRHGETSLKGPTTRSRSNKN